jgi:hypothetical protein
MSQLQQNKHNKATNPINTKEEVANSNDEKIDEDMPGFPGSPSQEKNIHPNTRNEKLTAGVIKKDDTDTTPVIKEAGTDAANKKPVSGK